MNPRTKLQQRVFSLSGGLLKLTSKQKEWAFMNCLDHIGYRNKAGITCLDCGHHWEGSQRIKTSACPECKMKLTIKTTRKKNMNQRGVVMAIVDVVEEFQVIRYFNIDSCHRAGWRADYNISEVVQLWFTPNGKLTVIAKGVAYGSRGFHGQMEIRANISNYYTGNKYNLFAGKIYPDFNCLPDYKRNGFTSQVQNVYPYDLLKKLLVSPICETLIKSKQFALLSASLGDRDNSVYRYWNSIKICIRNNYIVKDARTYLDYLELLDGFKKDLRSPKYICPVNLHKEHNRFVKKRAAIQRAERAVRDRKESEERKLRAIEEQTVFEQKKAIFFGLAFSSGDIEIKHLDSIQEFIAESEAHKHCVYTNSYYSKANTICFSASVNGVRTETIELSIESFKILQARGLHNSPSQYHDQIIEVMKKHIKHVKSRVKLSAKQAA